MYKTVKQGESSLQYRILPQEDNSSKVGRSKRLKRNRIACVLIVSLIVGCVTVAAAVIIPILLTTNIVALPAKYQTFAISTKHGRYNMPGTQFIAILPVKEAHFKEIKIFQAAESSSHRQVNLTEKALLFSALEDWTASPAWKAVGVYRLVIIVVSVILIIIVLIIIVRRKMRQKDDQELGWDMQGDILLSEPEDD